MDELVFFVLNKLKSNTSSSSEKYFKGKTYKLRESGNRVLKFFIKFIKYTLERVFANT